jgi:hypothetical protein
MIFAFHRNQDVVITHQRRRLLAPLCDVAPAVLRKLSTGFRMLDELKCIIIVGLPDRPLSSSILHCPTLQRHGHRSVAFFVPSSEVGEIYAQQPFLAISDSLI